MLAFWSSPNLHCTWKKASYMCGPPIGWDCLASPCWKDVTWGSISSQAYRGLEAIVPVTLADPSLYMAAGNAGEGPFTHPWNLRAGTKSMKLLFSTPIFKSRFEVKCPFSGCPLSSHVLSSNAGCDWHCRYREWQNFGVSVASFQLLGRLFLPWNPIQDNEVKIPTIPVDSIGFQLAAVIVLLTLLKNPSRFLTQSIESRPGEFYHAGRAGSSKQHSGWLHHVCTMLTHDINAYPCYIPRLIPSVLLSLQPG